MNVRKAVITVGSPSQRHLPFQALIDGDGERKAVLQIIVENAFEANVEEVALIVPPGESEALTKVAGEYAHQLTYIEQHHPRGYGHAISLAREFCDGEPFLHMVGDHLWVATEAAESCAKRLVRAACEQSCTVSAVKETREHLLPDFGAIGGRCLAGFPDLYEIETVLEKPTPTIAEQELSVPGIRAGYYLCFFGMHVLTPAVFGLLDKMLEDEDARPTLSEALNRLSDREKYLGMVMPDHRYDVGEKYGLLTAQLAISLSGKDRDEVLTRIAGLLASRQLSV
jgi:UTP--glucose-1-phosphate uridylyltransferase